MKVETKLGLHFMSWYSAVLWKISFGVLLLERIKRIELRLEISILERFGKSLALRENRAKQIRNPIY